MKTKPIIFLTLLIIITVNNDLLSEPIDSTVWALIKNKKSPITLSYFLSSDWRNPSLECRVGDVGPNWTFPLIAGMKITAFKEDFPHYFQSFNLDQPDKFDWAKQIFAAYGVCFGGNWDEHWRPQEGDTMFYQDVAEQLKKPMVRKAVWAFIEPALRHQIKTMEPKFQGMVVIAYEYVDRYFKCYDINKAKAWYDQDSVTNAFSSKDYLGVSHPMRKVTAMIERMMFKWKIMDHKTVLSWSNIISAWLKKTLGANYSKSKLYWNK